jgi:hypothetical protein
MAETTDSGASNNADEKSPFWQRFALAAVAGAGGLASLIAATRGLHGDPPVASPISLPAAKCIEVRSLTPKPLDTWTSPAYRVRSLEYTGPSPAAPFRLQANIEGPSGMRRMYESPGASCDLNGMLSGMLTTLGTRTEPYRLERIEVAFEHGSEGKCGDNTAATGELAITYSDSPGASKTVSFCDTCPRGYVYVCVNDMLRAAVDRLNGRN